MPTPRIIAVFDASGIEYGEIETCRTRDALEHVIQAQDAHGFFVKPARAHTGDGALAVVRVESESVVLADGRRVAIEALLDQVCAYNRVLIQELLAPHAVLAMAAGSTLATVRASVLRREESSTIHRTILRIPTGANMVDNSMSGGDHWQSRWLGESSWRGRKRVQRDGSHSRFQFINIPRHGGEARGPSAPDLDRGLCSPQARLAPPLGDAIPVVGTRAHGPGTDDDRDQRRCIPGCAATRGPAGNARCRALHVSFASKVFAGAIHTIDDRVALLAIVLVVFIGSSPLLQRWGSALVLGAGVVATVVAFWATRT